MREVPGAAVAPSGKADNAVPRPSRFLVLLSLAVVVTALGLRGTGWWQGDHGDLMDFVEGGRSILLGRDVYADLPGVMRFNYPPFGAVVMVPLALLGPSLAFPVASVLSLVSYGILVAVVARRMPLTWPTAAVVGLGGLALEPVFRTIALGQVNLWLAALVLVDLLILPRRFKGVLVGIAAGIKLTPAIFGLYFVLRRDWASAVRCALSFGVTVAVGWVIAPDASTRYWQSSSWLTQFVADSGVVQNQSLRVLLQHLAGPSVPEVLVLPLTLVVAAGGVLAAWRQTRAGADVASIVALAITGLVVSPISWTHHWVWVVPGLLVLAACGRWVSLWTVGAVFFLAPMWFVAGGGPQDPPLAVVPALVASAYFLAALAAIGYLLFAPPLVVSPPAPARKSAVGVTGKEAEAARSRHRERSASG